MPQDERKANQTREALATEATPATKARRAVQRQPILSEQRDLIVSMLTDNPNVTVSEVATAAGVARATVRKVKAQIEAGETETTEQYGRQLAQRLPLSERVRLWAQLARGKVDPRLAFAQKAALQRVEELIGHVTAKEKRESEATQNLPGPLFVLPPGCAVMVAPVQAKPQAVVVEAECNVLPDSVKPASD